MTCIVGFTDGVKVTIGGDSAGVGGLDLTVRADEKVFTIGEFVFGFTSSFRMGQILRYGFNPPAFVEGQTLQAYMATSFIDAVRNVLKNGGFARRRDEVESGGTFLVGVRGQLFCIFDDYQVAQAIDRYDAVGCGDQVANGAMFAMNGQMELTARERVVRALEAAERHSAGVRGPFVVLSV